MPANPALLNPSALTAKAPEVYEVKFTTTKGEFVVQVTRAWAPLGADRFYNLAANKFFDDASFFRVLSGFVVQFGLNADPQISKVWRAATINDDPVTQSNRPGYVTFATAGPNTRTTQVFINLGNNAQLDSMGFAPFGLAAAVNLSVPPPHRSGAWALARSACSLRRRAVWRFGRDGLTEQIRATTHRMFRRA